jgi:hypothetical protein
MMHGPNGPSHLKVKDVERAIVALSNCGVISANDRGTPQIGATTTLNGLEDSLSMTSCGVTLAIALVTFPAHASPHLSKSLQKEREKPRVSQESLVIESGKARTFPLAITLSKPLQLSMMRRLLPKRQIGGRKVSSAR